MIEQPSKGRATFKTYLNSLYIEIPAKKNWLILIFMSLWMGGWIFGETSAIGIVFLSDTPVFANAFLLIWLLIWTIGGAFVVYVILWQLIGREIIVIENGLLSIEKSVKGIRRKKTYDIKYIKNLSINPTQDMGIWGIYNSRSLLGMKAGKIKFDYGMKTVKFANDVDEAEARMIIEKMKENSNFTKDNFIS